MRELELNAAGLIPMDRVQVEGKQGGLERGGIERNDTKDTNDNDTDEEMDVDGEVGKNGFQCRENNALDSEGNEEQEEQGGGVYVIAALYCIAPKGVAAPATVQTEVANLVATMEQNHEVCSTPNPNPNPDPNPDPNPNPNQTEQAPSQPASMTARSPPGEVLPTVPMLRMVCPA